MQLYINAQQVHQEDLVVEMVNVLLESVNATLTSVGLIVIHGVVSLVKIVTMDTATKEQSNAVVTVVTLVKSAMLAVRLHSKQRHKYYVHNNLINHQKHG
jgi:hypothetical protein